MVWVQITLYIVLLVALTNCNVRFDLSLATHECLETKAIAADYDPLGEFIDIGNLTVYQYESPDNINKKRLLICVHDIYGIENDNFKQITDQMAIQSGGFIVVLPDFFRGDAWHADRDPAEREEWSKRVTDYNAVIKPDLLNLVAHYQAKGVEEFAIYGMCYGGKIATLAAIELNEYFKASALVHPSSVTTEEADDVKIPMYLMPASTDLNMTDFYEVLKTNFGDNCGHRRFDDMHHGFCGNRGNFSDPVNRERVDEVITTLGAFFDRNLNETKQNDSPNIQPYNLLLMTLFALVFIMSRNWLV